MKAELVEAASKVISNHQILFDSFVSVIVRSWNSRPGSVTPMLR